jgi:hypothetical protein
MLTHQQLGFAQAPRGLIPTCDESGSSQVGMICRLPCMSVSERIASGIAPRIWHLRHAWRDPSIGRPECNEARITVLSCPHLDQLVDRYSERKETVIPLDPMTVLSSIAIAPKSSL